MMIRHSWARHIPVRWPEGASGLFLASLLGCLSAPLLGAAPPASNPTRTATGLTSLASGVKNLERKDPQHAEQPLDLARKFLPELKDYTSFYLGQAQFQKGDFGAAAHTLEAVWTLEPPSPLTSRAVLLAAQAKLQDGDPAGAEKLVRKYWTHLQRPQADLVLAMAADAAQDGRAAALAYQRIYYQFPTSPEAAQAEAVLGRLRTSLGSAFPVVDAKTVLTRAQKLVDGGDTARAKRDLSALISGAGGADRELAQVRLGAADYFAKSDAAAYRYLKSLHVSSSDADAERLYYLANCARRLDRNDEMLELVRELNEEHPGSVWRREALVSVGNYFVVKNQPTSYLPLFKAYYESFPDGPQAAYCHWKVAWNQYLERRSGIADRLRYHVIHYPADEKAGGALYYLGRNSESVKDYASAKAYYQAASDNYPNFYYGVLSRKRLAEPAFTRAVAAPGVQEFLSAVNFPHPDFGGFHASGVTRFRIERCRQLYKTGLNDLAEGEMRFGAKTDSQGHLLAMELAQRCVREGNPAQGLRWIKALAPNYLYMPLSAAPASFWRLAFPLPFKNELARNSKARELDPYMVAALVRQESEFNPTAISRSNAYGLTQVLPSTGRSISRKAGIRRFRTSMLFSPDINLRLGTFYVRMLLDGLEGQWESALASYNAGKSRVVNWRTWFDFREPAEFVETIPFTETRNYVQIVMRNADVYRRLYGENAHAALKAAPDIPVAIQKVSYSKPVVKAKHHKHKVKARSKAAKRGKKAIKSRTGKKNRTSTSLRRG